jgi:menaquinone-dependent protoporphyrinogen IX oxidase
MAKILVTYKSQYGTTRKYAEWIADALGTDLRDITKLKAKDLMAYDVVIAGGPVYVGSLTGMELCAKTKLPHLIVFTVGLSDPETANYQDMMSKAFPKKDMQPEQVFHFRGAIDYAKLSFIHRNMLTVVKKSVEHVVAEERTPTECVILDTFGTATDFSEEQAVVPLLTYVNDRYSEK